MSEQGAAENKEQPSQVESSYAVTVSLLFVLISVFFFELMLASAGQRFEGRGWDFEVDLLKNLGALNRRLVFTDGQWWRLLVAPLLHGGPIHVALNSLALLIIGPRLEGLVGPRWFLAAFAISCVFGDVLSLLLNSPNVVSVGASGGIMGLFATALLTSFRLEPGSALRSGLQQDAARVLIPTLVPAVLIPMAGAAQDGVDVAAHLGGAIGGLIIGIFLYCREAELEGLLTTPRK